ncbi:MAG: ABC-2 transporter permease [Clostridium sp.]|nr:ABC-2 transporter permease [Clostridium sp.]
MKGLILKELYLVKSFAKQYVILLIFMAAWSIMVHNTSFVAVYIMVLGSSLVMSTTSMDESVSFNKLAVTMPIDTGNLVKSKYAMLFISVIGGGALVWLFEIATSFMPSGETMQINSEGMGGMIAFFMAANAASLPVLFKVGAVKARYTYIIVMVAAGALILGSNKLLQTGMDISLDEVLSGSEGAFTLTMVVLAVIVVIISYFISVKIVQKKEW